MSQERATTDELRAETTPHGSPTRLARIGVVLVNYHGLDDTLECLASCTAALDAAVDLIVVDNDSGDEEAAKIAAAFPAVTVIANDHNGGWAGGNNVGIRRALAQGADWVLLLNNDTTIAPELFATLREAAARERYGILGPVINEYDQRDCVQTEAVRFNPRDDAAFFARLAVEPEDGPNPTIVPCDIVNGCAVMISREVFDAIGLIDERFFLICEESDFCLRALEAGFQCGVIAKSLVWHKHSASFARAGSPLQRYYGVRNLRLLLRKHPPLSGRKGRFASWLTYQRFVWHLFSFELDHNNPGGARSVIAGWQDGILRRYGYCKNPGAGLSTPAWIVYRMLNVLWKLRGG